ncbi:response regulator transcription factor [Burkholderia cenocepacia]|nr:response regulator transcription factor [Burkholderia cenocepacia]
MRILLISPPNPEAARLDKAFRESTHGVEQVEGLRDGCFAATQDRFDAIVIIASDKSACMATLDTLPRLAASASGAAIALIVTGSTPGQRAGMLQAGCDVCLPHPCSFVELHERLRALWRRSGAAPPPSSITLDAAARVLEEGNRRLRLSAREFRLVECLLRESGRPVNRAAVLRYAWGDADIEPETVNALVVRLRRKLAAHAFSTRIETVARYGFRLDASG